MQVYRIIALSASALLIFINLEAQQMWPGDANNNGIVNAVDVLFIGLANDADGPERPGGTTIWEPQSFDLWPQSFPNGLNYGYADGDGDGEIEDDDIDNAILPNFGLTHEPEQPDFYANAAAGSGAPKITLTPSATLVEEGAVVDISLALGDLQQPISNFYGIAFRFSYDQELLAPNGIAYDDVEDSWINADMEEEVEDLFVNEQANGRAELALTRVNQTPISGSGEVASFSIFIEDIIVGLTVDTFRFKVDSVLLIDQNQKSIPLIPDQAEIVVAKDTNLVSSSESAPASPLKLYPNPAKEQAWLHLPFHLQQLQLLDQQGSVQLNYTDLPGGRTIRLPLSQLPPGLYFLRGRGDKGQFRKKLVVFSY